MYIHLNPTTAKLVEKPENWEYSSYNYFLIEGNIKNISEISIKNMKNYKKYIESNIEYQKKLKRIKKLLLE